MNLVLVSEFMSFFTSGNGDGADRVRFLLDVYYVPAAEWSQREFRERSLKR